MDNTTVEALKDLCAAIKGGEAKAADVPGETIPEVIKQITAAFVAYAAKQATGE